MKRIVLLFVAICLSITIFAQKETSEVKANAVTMVSFVQDSPFRDATITLKNNLEIPVTSIKARIVYKDMNGEILDYQDIDKSIEIAPKMSKTFTIKAFGKSADYVYYKAKFADLHRKFKVDFRLGSYNSVKVEKSNNNVVAEAPSIKEEKEKSQIEHKISQREEKIKNNAKEIKSSGRKEVEEYDDFSPVSNVQEDDSIEKNSNDGSDVLTIILSVFAIILVVMILYMIYFKIPYNMATNRGRNAALWILLCFVFSPLLVYIILAIIGDSDEKKREELIREMERRKQ